jgi:hypothetical protein
LRSDEPALFSDCGPEGRESNLLLSVARLRAFSALLDSCAAAAAAAAA